MLAKKTVLRMLSFYITLKQCELESKVNYYLKNEANSRLKYKVDKAEVNGYFFALTDAGEKMQFEIDKYFNAFYYDLSDLYYKYKNCNIDTRFKYTHKYSGQDCDFKNAFNAVNLLDSADLLNFIATNKNSKILTTDGAGTAYYIELKRFDGYKLGGLKNEALY